MICLKRFILAVWASGLCIFPGFSQPGGNFRAIDRYALAASEKVEGDLNSLYDYLVAEARNDREKVRSFFTWITHHIRYDLEMALALEKKPVPQSVQATLNRRKAVCLGYAELFEALCEKAKIPCAVVSGYSKTLPTSQPDLEEPDHAWNAVLIDGKWQLLDASWTASIVRDPQGFPGRDSDFYFFAPPTRFLLDHLPADPMWQLVDCPLSADQFRTAKINYSIPVSLADSCFAYEDSIRGYWNLTPPERTLHSLQNSYRFNPTTSNAEQLGHAYMDRFIRLSEVEEQLQQSDSIENLLTIQRQLFRLAGRAQQYIELYDWQKENLAYTHINYAVGLSRKMNDLEEDRDIYNTLRAMQQHLSQAQTMLGEVPQNLFTEQGLTRCKEYLAFVSQSLEAYSDSFN